jgi:hypothetical protein
MKCSFALAGAATFLVSGFEFRAWGFGFRSFLVSVFGFRFSDLGSLLGHEAQLGLRRHRHLFGFGFQARVSGCGVFWFLVSVFGFWISGLCSAMKRSFALAATATFLV